MFLRVLLFFVSPKQCNFLKKSTFLRTKKPYFLGNRAKLTLEKVLRTVVQELIDGYFLQFFVLITPQVMLKIEDAFLNFLRF